MIYVDLYPSMPNPPRLAKDPLQHQHVPRPYPPSMTSILGGSRPKAIYALQYLGHESSYNEPGSCRHVRNAASSHRDCSLLKNGTLHNCSKSNVFGSFMSVEILNLLHHHAFHHLGRPHPACSRLDSPERDAVQSV